MNVLYPASINYNESDKRYTVSFLDLPEAITEGETMEEALFNASEVLTLTLEGRVDEGMDIPQPSASVDDSYLISPNARAQAALLMRWAKGDHTTSEIARTLNTSWPAIARLEDLHHWPNLKQLERVAAALGQRLVISLEPLELAKAPGLSC
ncbi:MAG TPA: type II toxin-antitoxin system HicB family antitoxin [Gammaproteobacteria bacterium]|nr:type II toxin-antitoxin system HicB family antitoxin [Gammaproteobacteria bacterium]